MVHSFEKQFYVYTLASKRNGTLYIGVTSDLAKRLWKHKNHVEGGFTKKYSVYKLEYYEVHRSSHQAILREKKLKNWKRAWKIALIEKQNPLWNDLYNDL